MHKAKDLESDAYISMPVAMMSDTHLKNTVDLWIGRMMEAKKALDVNYIMTGISTNEMIEKAKKQLAFANEKLPFYIYECTIRGISNTPDHYIPDALQSIFNRSKSVQEIDAPIDCNYEQNKELLDSNTATCF
ncbi:MAG: hypothetical protein ACPG5V_00780 [Vibrio cyclitrophicus]